MREYRTVSDSIAGLSNKTSKRPAHGDGGSAGCRRRHEFSSGSGIDDSASGWKYVGSSISVLHHAVRLVGSVCDDAASASAEIQRDFHILETLEREFPDRKNGA